MLTFTATLLKFGEKGEKTGWTYIEIPLAITEALRPGQKTSYRVKGILDAYPIERVALVPMGLSERDNPDDTARQFIIAINATMRRGIRKEEGANIRVSIEVDDSPMPESADLLACLADEPDAMVFFRTLSKGHQTYFSNWIESAKTTETKTKRIAQAVNGLVMKLGYGEMIRYYKRKVQE